MDAAMKTQHHTTEKTMSTQYFSDYQDASLSSLLDNDHAFTMHRLPVPNVFENKLGLAEDLKYLASMPELCDVTFLVGENKEPVRAVRAILAARSRVFHKLLYSASRGNTTPKKKRHSNHPHESRLSRIPFIGRRNSIGGAIGNGDNDAVGTLKCPRNIPVEEFDADVFRQLIEYCHTGCVTLNAETILGLMNASDHYGLDELRRVCIEYMHSCINLETVCALLRSAEKYIQYKATKSLVQKALEYVDEHGEAVLRYPAFLTLPQHVVRLILSRDELQADEICKFQAALKWSKRHVRKTTGSTVRSAMKPFIDTIGFHLIPASVLMQAVRDTNVVPDEKILTALAFQADPSSIDPSSLSTTPMRLRLSMLSLSLQDNSGLYDGLDEAATTASESNGTCSDTGSTVSTPKPLHSSTFLLRDNDDVIDDDPTPTNSAPAESENEDVDGVSGDVSDDETQSVTTDDVRLVDNSLENGGDDILSLLDSPENIHDNNNVRASKGLPPDGGGGDHLTELNLTNLMFTPSIPRRQSIDEISNATHSSSNYDTISSISMSTTSSSSASSVSSSGSSFGRADGYRVPIRPNIKVDSRQLPGMLNN